MKDHNWSVIKGLFANGVRLGIYGDPIETEFCLEQNLTQEEAEQRCRELSKELNIPEYEGDSMFIEFLSAKEENINVRS